MWLDDPSNNSHQFHPLKTHLLNNEPHNEGVAHCESSLFNNEGIGAHCWNNEPYNEQKSSLFAAMASELIMSPPSLLQTL